MRITTIIFSLTLLLCQLKGLATHIRGGEIVVKYVPNAPLTFEISIIGYSDGDSQVELGGGVINFGDGNTMSGPFQAIKENVSPSVTKVRFTVTHTYLSPSAAGYLISYQEDFRNDNIININNGNSVQTSFYLESLLVTDPFLGPNSTPVFTAIPNTHAQIGKTYRYNPEAYDPDGDLLTYRLVDVKRARGTIVGEYRQPDDPDFYSHFNQGNEANDGPPSLSIDRFTGEIVWDAPGDVINQELGGQICEKYAEYSLAVAVDEWRNVQGIWKKMGFVTRDFQITVCNGGETDLIQDLVQDTCIIAGASLDKRIIIPDHENQPIYIEAFGVPFELGASRVPQKNPGIDTLDIFWKTSCFHAREEPYRIQIRLISSNQNGSYSTFTHTWNVSVIAPPVTGITKMDQTDGSVKVSWDAYTCDEPDSLQIWRVEGLLDHAPCELQDPESLGFVLTGQVKADQITYVDQDIPGGKMAGDFSYHILPVYSDQQSEAFREVLTSIKKSTRSEIHFYPNPTRGNLIIDAKDQITQYRLLDLSGKTLISDNLNNSGEISGLSTFLKPGIYIIQFQDKNETIVDSGRLILSSH